MIPHYLLAVAAVAVHAACGQRVVLCAHGVRRRTADGFAGFVVAGGVILAFTLVAALLGFRL